jgi:hypothetical protein
VIDTFRSEVTYRRVYAMVFPWLPKVRLLPDVGLFDTCGLWLYPAPANDPRLTLWAERGELPSECSDG